MCWANWLGTARHDVEKKKIGFKWVGLSLFNRILFLFSRIFSFMVYFIKFPKCSVVTDVFN